MSTRGSEELAKVQGVFQSALTGFGDIITMDPCSFVDHGMTYALNGNSIVLVVRDVATTFGMAYPAARKTADETVTAMQMFVGDDLPRVKRFYSDNADALMAASRF